MYFYKKNFTAAIFDMDGTMFDTERLRFAMLKKASGELFSEEMSDEFLFDCLGVSAVTAERLAKARYGQDYPYQEIRLLADHLEREHIRTYGVPVKDGLYNLLERLKKNNIFIALATSSRREIAEEYLINAKVFRYFDIIVCGDDVTKGKPDPEIFQRAASELLCPPSECLIFEDSQNGLLAASASGGIPIFIKDLKEPEPQVKSLAFKAYDKMTDFLNDFNSYTPKCTMPQLNEYFPQNEENITVGIHGFGAIGGGYLAPVFSHWDGYTRPHEIIGATQNSFLINLVNSLGKYRIRYESQAYLQTITNVRLISVNDEEEMLSMYERSQLIGLSLPENVIRLQSGMIAKGLLQRYQNGGSDLTILIVMNKMHAARFVKHHIQAELQKLTDAGHAKECLARTHLIETVVNRMVIALSDDFILTKLKSDLFQLNHNLQEISSQYDKITDFLDYYQTNRSKKPRKKHLPASPAADSSAIRMYDSLSAFSSFAKTLSDINVTLFSSEPDMPLYIAEGSTVTSQLRQTIVISDINSMMEIKNKLSNGTHAIIAWYSALLGYRSIGQGMGDARVKNLALKIMKTEIRPALLIENPEYGRYINEFITGFLSRCRNSFQDKCSRVGRDVMRKLQSGERILGAIQMAQRHNIPSDGLEFGAACAILYCVQGKKPIDSESKKVKELYEQSNHVSNVLTYNGEYNKKIYQGLDPVKDKQLIDRIQQHFEQFRSSLLPLEN